MKNQSTRDEMENIIASRLMVSWRICASVFMGIYFLLTLGGCTWIGLMRSDDQSFTGKDSIVLQASRSDILDIIAEVGKSMGYSVLDKEANIIRLSSSSSRFDTELKGQLSFATLRISSNKDGTKLDIDVYVSGNFGTGGQEAANKLVSDFKARLLESEYMKATARTNEPIRENDASETQLGGGIRKELPAEHSTEVPKPEIASSTPATFPPKEAMAASTTPTVVTSTQGNADTLSSPHPSGKKLVCTKTANVRAVPSTKGKIIKILKKGEAVEHLGDSGKWINVRLSSGAIGWVFNDLLKSR